MNNNGSSLEAISKAARDLCSLLRCQQRFCRHRVIK